MPRTGRPTKLTPALTALCGRLVGRLSWTKAAAVVGITKKTVCEWMRLACRVKSRRHAAFRAAVLAAEARFVADRLADVVRAATPRRAKAVRTTTHPDRTVAIEVREQESFDWRAATWLLRCRHPAAFGDRRCERASLKQEVNELRRMMSDGRRPTDYSG